jgi:hypothetical protein
VTLILRARIDPPTRRGRSSSTDNRRLGYVRLVVDTLMAVAFPLCRRRLYSEQHGAMRAYQQMGKDAPQSRNPWDVKHRHRKRFGPWPTVSMPRPRREQPGRRVRAVGAGRFGKSLCSASHPGLRGAPAESGARVGCELRLVAVYEAARTMATRLASPGTRQKSAFNAWRRTRQTCLAQPGNSPR